PMIIVIVRILAVMATALAVAACTTTATFDLRSIDSAAPASSSNGSPAYAGAQNGTPRSLPQ
ncbi:hypothetical protein ABTL33_18795, partial [Acinetobacter baumannii]